MEIRKITEDYSVSGQIEPEDVAKIAAAGFRSLMCNRPDGESPDQPDYEAIEKAAREHGLKTCFLPVISGQLTDENAADFSSAMDELPKPVFAYCRTGTRCTALWSLDQGRRGSPVEDVLIKARDAGYDMTGLSPRIAAMREA